MSSEIKNDSPKQIFDRARLQVNRAKNNESFYEHDFLHRHIAAELAERIALINQDFDRAICFGGGEILRSALLKPQQIKELTISESVATGANESLLILDDADPELPRENYNLIVSFMGLHLVNDVVATLKAYRAALAPDGVFLAALAAGDTLTELRAAFAAAESKIIGGVGAHIHPFGTMQAFGDLLPAAGFALPVADCETLSVEYDAPQKLFADLRHTAQSNILHARPKNFLRRDVLARTQKIFMEQGGTATFEICYLMARAPAPNQAQPLKRGSATNSLSQALKKKT